MKNTLLAGPGSTLTLEIIERGDSAALAVDDIADAVATGHVPALSKALGKAWREEANCVESYRMPGVFNQLGMLECAVLAGMPKTLSKDCVRSSL